MKTTQEFSPKARVKGQAEVLRAYPEAAVDRFDVKDEDGELTGYTYAVMEDNDSDGILLLGGWRTGVKATTEEGAWANALAYVRSLR